MSPQEPVTAPLMRPPDRGIGVVSIAIKVSPESRFVGSSVGSLVNVSSGLESSIEAEDIEVGSIDGTLVGSMDGVDVG